MREALHDRLHADALGAELRLRCSFLERRTSSNWRELEAYLGDRGEVYQKDLGCTPAQVERALSDVRTAWLALQRGAGTRRYVGLLVKAAQESLQQDGSEMILQVKRDEPGRELLRWRFISLALPPSILVAAAADDGLLVPAAVRLLHESIAPGGVVAHNHVHHAAMMSFDELWESLRLRAVLHFGGLARSLVDGRATCPGLHREVCIGMKPEKQREERLKRQGDSVAHAEHMARWADTLRQAFIAAELLRRHLYHGNDLTNCPECMQVVRRNLKFFHAGRMRPYHLTATPYPWKGQLLEFERRRRDANEASVFRSTHRPRTKLMQSQMARERDFVRRAFQYLKPQEKESYDPEYEQLLLQYLRVKTAVFRLLVHPPGEHGLRNFLEHFRQIKVYAPEAELLRPRRMKEPGLKIGSTEYRVAPDAWFTIVKREDQEIEEGEPGEEPDREAAWLIHFKRKDAKKSRPLFRDDIRELDAEADRIGRALRQKPTRLRNLRGIDICGVEQAQPLWVSAETLRRTRQVSRQVAGSRPWLGLQPLRLTLHAGEDFLWLTSGVRAVAEPFHWHLIERGDRIGHGLALTLDPGGPRGWWKRKAGEAIPVTRFDRLLDLAFLAEYTESPTDTQENWLRTKIRETVEALRWRTGGQSDTELVENVKKLWRTLGGRTTRRLLEQLDSPEPFRVAEGWIHNYLLYKSVQEKAQEEIRLCVDEESYPERELLIEARKKLIREMARWQVCIESNPSSNLVVGSLDAVASQDFLQRRPTKKAEYGQETLTWTISTDDPITFSTTLADEYAYTWAGLVLRDRDNCDPTHARALLDEAAATSMRMRFTVPRPKKGKGRASRNR